MGVNNEESYDGFWKMKDRDKRDETARALAFKGERASHEDGVMLSLRLFVGIKGAVDE